MADVSTCRVEGLCEMRRLDWTRGFEEDGCEDKALHKSEVVCSEGFSRDCVEAPCRTLHCEHGAFAKEGFNAHNLNI